MRIPLLKLKPGREKSVVNRHPWIFSGGVATATIAKEGDVVEVQSSTKEVLGYGFYSADSQISCRMFDWGKEPKDFESEAYWLQKMRNAYSLRKSVVISAVTDSYRLIHAEGDFMPGLIADVYKNILVAQFLIEGINKRKDLFINCFEQLGFDTIYQRSSGSSKNQQDVKAEEGWIKGKGNPAIEIVENGQRFKVNVEEGQKTGFFLDQRDNRQLLKTLAKGKTVLNAFSYTGGFSVYAAAGEAKEVHSLDISAEAVALAEENVTINYPTSSHKGIVKDCFAYLREMPADFYDLIVLDPPAFAKNKGSVDRAARGYKDINMQAFNKMKPEGLLFTFSCSQHISKDLFQKIVFGAAADAGRNVQIIHQLHQPPDHPVNIFHPEGEYLKGLVLWVE